MGRNHVRVYRELASAELVAVADCDAGTAGRIAQLSDCQAYVDHRQMLECERPDVVSVAVPTAAHCEVVLDALSAGSNVLVEKPMALTVEHAEKMVDAARSAGRLLMVGHVERYNPAIVELRKRLMNGELGRVFQIHARRLSPLPRRIVDAGVVFDLATHDIDIMWHLIGQPVTRAYAETATTLQHSHEDLLLGILHFASGTFGLVEANWLTPTKLRELYVTGEAGMYHTDYLTQDLYFYENGEVTTTDWNALTVLRGVSEGAMTRFVFPKSEPLAGEITAFLAAVERGDEHGIVTGAEGLRVVKLALALLESSRVRSTVECGSL